MREVTCEMPGRSSGLFRQRMELDEPKPLTQSLKEKPIEKPFEEPDEVQSRKESFKAQPDESGKGIEVIKSYS